MSEHEDPTVEEAESIIRGIWDDPQYLEHCRDAIDAAKEGRISQKALLVYGVLRKAYEEEKPQKTKKEAIGAAISYAMHWMARITCLIKDPPQGNESMTALEIATTLTREATEAMREASRELTRALEDELAPHGLMPLPLRGDDKGEWWKDGNGEIPYTGE